MCKSWEILGIVRPQDQTYLRAGHESWRASIWSRESTSQMRFAMMIRTETRCRCEPPCHAISMRSIYHRGRSGKGAMICRSARSVGRQSGLCATNPPPQRLTPPSPFKRACNSPSATLLDFLQLSASTIARHGEDWSATHPMDYRRGCDDEITRFVASYLSRRNLFKTVGLEFSLYHSRLKMFRLNLILNLLQICSFNLAAPLSTIPSLKTLNSESLSLMVPTNLSLHNQPM